MKNPLVSILIASYNKEKYVNRCIKSCLSQTYKNIEIIFIDDGSKDSSYKIAKEFKGKLEPIKVVLFDVDTYRFKFKCDFCFYL